MIGFLNTWFFRVYIVPGAVFQSVMVGGGYGIGLYRIIKSDRQ